MPACGHTRRSGSVVERRSHIEPAMAVTLAGATMEALTPIIGQSRAVWLIRLSNEPYRTADARSKGVCPGNVALDRVYTFNVSNSKKI